MSQIKQNYSSYPYQKENNTPNGMTNHTMGSNTITNTNKHSKNVLSLLKTLTENDPMTKSSEECFKSHRSLVRHLSHMQLKTMNSTLTSYKSPNISARTTLVVNHTEELSNSLKQPWKDAGNNSQFFNGIQLLKNKQLSGWEKSRIGLADRSYAKITKGHKPFHNSRVVSTDDKCFSPLSPNDTLYEASLTKERKLLMETYCHKMETAEKALGKDKRWKFLRGVARG